MCIAGSLTAAYQALHHFHNLTTVVMVLSLNYQLEPTSAANGVFEASRAPLRWKSWVVLLAGLTMMIWFDFRISVPGTTMLVLSLGLSRLGSAVEVIAKERELTQNSLDTFALIGGLAISAFWCHFREQQFSDPKPYNPITANLAIILINIFLSTASLSIGGSLFKKQTHRVEESYPQEQDWTEQDPLGNMLMSISLTLLVHIGAFVLPILPPLVSPWQWIGYVIASTAGLSSRVGAGGERGWSDIRSSALAEYSRLLFVFLASLLLLGLVLPSLHTDQAYAGPYGTSVETFRPSHSLEVVIAHYDEPASAVTARIIELLGVPIIANLRPAFSIYDKANQTASSNLLLEIGMSLNQSSTPMPNVQVFQLANVGRETDTYLEHITSRWETLADHTVFLQSGVHHVQTYTRRIQDYFIPATGFLSLADGRGHCSSCRRCFDRDWTEKPELLQDIFADFNPDECKDMVLTYRGQFIVSSERVRRNQKETYERWLQELRDPRSTLHTPPYIDSAWSTKQDSLSAPRAGYTLERMWGVMFQCNDMNMSKRCPSMLSSVVCPAELCGMPEEGDCQCLDQRDGNL